MIKDFLRARTHQDVITLFEKGVDLSGFNVTHHKLWSLYVPKTIHNFCPVLNAHTDTVFKRKPLNFSEINGVISNHDRTTGLGADDRAGCYIMHKLIKGGQQFIYVITDQEETGGIGGSAFTKSQEFSDLLDKISCFIGLDRRGNDDCASYDYDNEEMFDLMEEYGGYKYAMGSFTDVMTFAQESTIACCNLSIGYENEHRATESLNLGFMEDTYTFLAEFMPEIFWEKQFKSEYKPRYQYNWKDSNYWKEVYGIHDEEEVTNLDEYPEVCCDMCQQHKPLYDVAWGMVCKSCLKLLGVERDEIAF